MAIEVMLAVFKHSKTKGNTRLVMLAIADHAHPDGAGAIPHQSTISKYTGGLDERTIREHTKRAVELNELEMERPDRRRGYHYTILLPGLAVFEARRRAEDSSGQAETAPEKNSGPTPEESSGLTGEIVRCAPEKDSAPYIEEPTSNPHLTNSSASAPAGSPGERQKSSGEEEFENEFWALYPRRLDRKAALQKFIAVRRTVSLDVILTGLRQWNAYWVADRTPIDKIPYPATWLNKARWEAAPAVRSGAAVASPDDAERMGAWAA